MSNQKNNNYLSCVLVKKYLRSLEFKFPAGFNCPWAEKMQKRFVARSCHLSSSTPLAANNIFSEFCVFSFGVFSFYQTV